MPIVNDDGVHETELDSVAFTLPPELKRVYIMRDVMPPAVDPGDDKMVVSPEALQLGRELDEAETNPTTGTGLEVNLEDRRNQPNPNEPKWENVLPSLKDLGSRAGAYLGIPGLDTPIVPERPATKLGVEAGLEDIKIEKAVDSRSLLDRAIDDTLDGANFFYNIGRAIQGKPSEKFDTQTPFSQREFSKGLLNKDAPVGNTKLAREVEDFKVQASKPYVALKDTPQEDIDTAINVAMGAGPASIAGTKSASILKTPFALAATAERQGFSADEIFKSTGFFKGADGKWRYEIDDSLAKFNKNWADNPTPTQKQTGMKTVKLPEVIDHPTLFEAYPKLKDYQVIYDNNFTGIAEFSGEAIRVGKRSFTEGVPAYQDKSIIMHEVQHAIQDLEGFAKGGMPYKASRGEYKLKYEADVNKLRLPMIDLLAKERRGEMLSAEEQSKLDYLKVVFDKYVEYQKAGDKKAFEYYQELAGEVEARNVQTRVDLTPAERQRFNPIDTEDTPRAKQIVQRKATGTTPYRSPFKDGFLSYD